MTDDDREMLFQLHEDVEILEGCLAGGGPSPALARTLVAPMLRRWICEGLINRVQCLLLPHRLQFPIIESPAVIEMCREGKAQNWLEVVELMGGMHLSQFRAKPEFAHLEAEFHGLDPKVPVLRSAAKLADQKVFYLDGRFFTRKDLLSLHANKRGGVHLDQKRDDEEEHINEISRLLEIEPDVMQMHIRFGDESPRHKLNPERRRKTYDAYELIGIDTARIFVRGVRASADALAELSAGR